MTSPIENIEIECPRCGVTYTDWYRASINARLDPELAADRDYIRQASTATCPDCGWTVDFEILVASREGFHFYSPPERP